MSETVYIGVATTVVPKKRAASHGDLRRPAMQYVRMARAALSEQAQVFLFDPQQVDLNASRLSAWVPVSPQHPEQGWVKKTVPWPDVIYENVFVHLAMKGYSSGLRQAAQRRHTPLFNPILPGKWRMVQLLKEAGMATYSPETERLRDVSQLRSRLRDWGTVFVKPTGGYGGMDVNRLERLPDGRYRVSVDRTQSKTGHVRAVLTDTSLTSWVTRRQQRPHLVQRGLKLMSVNRRKVDFRVVLHRDKQGVWQMVGIVPKVAALDGVVTNLVAGGERMDLTTLSRLAKTEGKTIPIPLLEERAQAIAAQLSRRYPSIGLVGFDMAVEENGAVKMIEMNPKPARSLLSTPMLDKLAVYTVGFATYLARKH